ncbi:MAG: DoxX family protein [Bacteroidota bacterium]|nr:DoxX family protein [Bacteroidota bacterium]
MLQKNTLITNTLLLRIAVAIILLTHSIPGMFDNGINNFGMLYLNEVGFSPYGVAIAWAIKISHVLCAFLLLLNKWIRPAAIITILILMAGIVMVHFKEGWFVVGGGRNGVEYNFLLICVLLTIMYPGGINKSVAEKVNA